MLVEKKIRTSTFNSMNIYLTSTQTSMKNVLPIEINIIFEIYSPSADTREDTGLQTR